MPQEKLALDVTVGDLLVISYCVLAVIFLARCWAAATEEEFDGDRSSRLIRLSAARLKATQATLAERIRPTRRTLGPARTTRSRSAASPEPPSETFAGRRRDRPGAAASSRSHTRSH